MCMSLNVPSVKLKSWCYICCRWNSDLQWVQWRASRPSLCLVDVVLTVGAVTGSTPRSMSFSAWWMWFCRSFTVGKYDRLCFSGIESALLNSSFSTYRLKHRHSDEVLSTLTLLHPHLYFLSDCDGNIAIEIWNGFFCLQEQIRS